MNRLFARPKASCQDPLRVRLLVHDRSLDLPETVEVRQSHVQEVRNQAIECATDLERALVVGYRACVRTIEQQQQLKGGVE